MKYCPVCGKPRPIINRNRRATCGDPVCVWTRQGWLRGQYHGGGYRAQHYRLHKLWGRAALHLCAECLGPAADWANLTGNYDDVDDFAPLCKPCHGQYDRRVPSRV